MALGDFPDLSKVSNDTVACLRTVSALMKKNLITPEVNDYLRYALVCNVRSIVLPFNNALNAYGMPDFFSLEDLADAVNRIFEVATGRYTLTISDSMRTPSWGSSFTSQLRMPYATAAQTQPQPKFGSLPPFQPQPQPQPQPQQEQQQQQPQQKENDDEHCADTSTWD